MELRELTKISIHALRVEGDILKELLLWGEEISIHALRVEGDIQLAYAAIIRAQFLSTPSGWRATRLHIGAGLAALISIHALRVEGDSKNGQNFRLFLRKREKNLPL